jgi:hypothetical protein
MLTAACVQEAELPPAGPDAGDVPSELPRLRIDGVAAESIFDSVPVTGKGPAGGTLYINTSQGQTEKLLGPSGSFCLDLDLQANILNKVSFQAANQEGLYTQEVTLEILQRPADDVTEPPATVGELVNIAERAPSFNASNVSVESGSFDMAVDGNVNTYVQVKHTSALGSDWLGFTLAERAGIDHIKIVGTPDCHPSDYAVYLSDMEAPKNPWETGAQYEDWELLEYVWDGEQEQTIIPPLGDPKARHLAISFLADSCGAFFGYSVHEIREIEVWSTEAAPKEEPEPTPEETKVTCEDLDNAQ